jgi:hypothetical protein
MFVSYPTSKQANSKVPQDRRTPVTSGPPLPVVGGAKIDATRVGAAEVRQAVAQCLLLGVGLPVSAMVGTHALDPNPKSVSPRPDST